jgi:hypothetical protein
MSAITRLNILTELKNCPEIDVDKSILESASNYLFDIFKRKAPSLQDFKNISKRTSNLYHDRELQLITQATHYHEDGKLLAITPVERTSLIESIKKTAKILEDDLIANLKKISKKLYSAAEIHPRKKRKTSSATRGSKTSIRFMR